MAMAICYIPDVSHVEFLETIANNNTCYPIALGGLLTAPANPKGQPNSL
jgi:hypothetical protein